jgi:alpha,alpha-trehalase
MASRIRGDALRLVEAMGLREYYDPLTGAGLGGADFSWSAAVWLSWLSPACDGKAGRDLVTAA